MRTVPVLLAVALLAGCTGDAPPVDTDLPADTDTDVVVDGPEVERVEVIPDPDLFCMPDCWTLYPGVERQLFAIAYDADGNELADVEVAWSTSDLAVASVSDAGLVFGEGAGAATITATVAGVEGSHAVTVLPPQIASIVLTPEEAEIADGATQAYAAVAYDADGNVVEDVVFQWDVSNPTVASIDGDGVATGVGPGHTVVSVWTDAGGYDWASLVVVSETALPEAFGLDAVAFGDHHGCGVDADGLAWCWGWNYFGQMGDGELGDSTESFPTPDAVLGGHTFVGIAAGMDHSCGVDTGGDAWCWGLNDRGQLGTHETIGEVGGTVEPFVVLTDLEFVEIDGGGSHTCGVTADGVLACWGGNYDGQLGMGDLVDRATPEPLPAQNIWAHVTTGLSHTCATDVLGKAWCWGEGVDEPVAVDTEATFTRLSTLGTHTCGLDPDGHALCWGNNTFGQLGDGTTTWSSAPVAVKTDLTFVAIATGAHHTCAVDALGQAWCWGYGGNAALGTGKLDDALEPVEVAGDHVFLDVASAANAVCGTTADEGTWCWGSSYTGELGAGFGGPGRFSAVPWPLAAP